MTLMARPDDFDQDAVFHLLLTGAARTLDEAEEMFLDESLPEVMRLAASNLTDDELARHPLMILLRVRGSRPSEDSVL